MNENIIEEKTVKKKICDDLKDQVMKIINYEKKEMTPLTFEEKEIHENQKICHICEQ